MGKKFKVTEESCMFVKMLTEKGLKVKQIADITNASQTTQHRLKNAGYDVAKYKELMSTKYENYKNKTQDKVNKEKPVQMTTGERIITALSEIRDEIRISNKLLSEMKDKKRGFF